MDPDQGPTGGRTSPSPAGPGFPRQKAGAHPPNHPPFPRHLSLRLKCERAAASAGTRGRPASQPARPPPPPRTTRAARQAALCRGPRAEDRFHTSRAPPPPPPALRSATGTYAGRPRAAHLPVPPSPVNRNRSCMHSTAQHVPVPGGGRVIRPTNDAGISHRDPSSDHVQYIRGRRAPRYAPRHRPLSERCAPVPLLAAS